MYFDVVPFCFQVDDFVVLDEFYAIRDWQAEARIRQSAKVVCGNPIQVDFADGIF